VNHIRKPSLVPNSSEYNKISSGEINPADFNKIVVSDQENSIFQKSDFFV